MARATGSGPLGAGYEIILLAGQSNMTGSPGNGAWSSQTDPRILQYTTRSTITASGQTLPPGQVLSATERLLFRSTPDAVGPGYALAQTLLPSLAPDRKILVLPLAQGNSRLLGSGAIWDPDTGNRYDNMVDYALRALNLPGENRIAGLYWSQGEADLGPGAAAAYETAFIDMAASLRADLATPGMPIVISGINPDRVDVDRYVLEMIEAQQRLENRVPNLRYVDAPAAMGQVGQDDVHFSAAGNRLRGADAQEAFAALTTWARDVTGAAPDVVRAVIIDGILGFDALANDVVAAGGALRATPRDWVGGSNGGLFSVLADGTVRFHHDNDFAWLKPGAIATTFLDYAVSDGLGGTDVARFTVAVERSAWTGPPGPGAGLEAHTVVVRAGGVGGTSLAPAFSLLADGVMVGVATILSPQTAAQRNMNGVSYRDYAFTFHTAESPERIEVVFNNDGVDPRNGEDRNLYVSRIAVDGVAYDTLKDGHYDAFSGGPSRDGVRVEMFWNGAMIFELPRLDPPPADDPIAITVRASGSGGPSTAPEFVVLVDGAAIGTGRIANPLTMEQIRAEGPVWDTFTFIHDGPRPGRVEIVYDNDGSDPVSGQNRNLFVDHVDIGGLVLESERDGYFTPEFDGPGRAGPREDLLWNGVLAFDMSDAAVF